jgi:hypothetical protein
MHRACEHLRQRVRVTVVGGLERGQVAATLRRFNDSRGVSVLKQHEVQDEPSRAPVAVNEGMDPFEPSVVMRCVHDRMAASQVPR